MERKFQEETNCSSDEAGPIAPRLRENAHHEGRGVRDSRSYEGQSNPTSKRGSKSERAPRGSIPCSKARGSMQVTDELDQKWADAEDKFRCDACNNFIQDNAMVFVLENKKAVCSKCVVGRGKTLNSKARSMSQMLLQDGQDEVLRIRDAKQIAQGVVRAGDFTSKRRSLPIRVPNDDLENKSGAEDDGEDHKVQAPVYNARTRRQLPRALGADCTSRRRKVRRASEPLSPIQRPKFDNILMDTGVVSEPV